MSNAMAVYEKFDNLQRAADALHKSGYFADVKSQAQAVVKVMAGAELGLPPFASMTGIHIIQGKPVVGANLIATMVKNSGRYDYKIAKADGKECVIDWFENGKKVGESAFTFAEAEQAKLTGKDVWKAYPSDLLFARAISRGARRFAPGIFGGSPIYTPEELGADVDEEGNVIVAEVVQPPPNPVEVPTSAPSESDQGNIATSKTKLCIDLIKYCATDDGFFDENMADGILAELATTKNGPLTWKRLQGIDENRFAKWLDGIYAKWQARG
jgi:hypothetical protein